MKGNGTSTNSSTSTDSPSIGHDVAAVVPALIWPITVLILLLLFRRSIEQLAQMVMTRVRDGGAIKLWQFELGQTYIPGGGAMSVNAIQAADDADHARRRERAQIAVASRRVYIVHRLQTSADPSQLYDVVLYAVPATEGSLASVRHIEYFFGRAWGHIIYTSEDRAKGFPVTLSAWGPFLCTAKLVFTDGTSYTMYRFIDFEMGPAGPGVSRNETPKRDDAEKSQPYNPPPPSYPSQ